MSEYTTLTVSYMLNPEETKVLNELNEAFHSYVTADGRRPFKDQTLQQLFDSLMNCGARYDVASKIGFGMMKMGMKDKKWGEIFNNAMFLGMISAFLGYVFCDVGKVFTGDTSGLIPVCVMVVSALVMAVCGLLSIKTKARWMEDYALPMSLVLGMASAIPLTGWLS